MKTQLRTAPALATTPRLPRVNLLPPEIGERRRLRRAQYGAGAAVFAAGLVVVGLYHLAAGDLSTAQAELSDTQQRHSALQQKNNNYAEVKQVYADVESREAMLNQAMGAEILWSSYLNDLSHTLPAGVWVTNLSVTSSAPAAGTPTASPPTAPADPAAALTPTGLGTVTITGTATDHDRVADWLEVMAKQKGYTNPYFSNSTEELIGEQRVVTFTSTATITPDALSGRYRISAGSTP